LVTLYNVFHLSTLVNALTQTNNAKQIWTFINLC